MLVCEKPKFIYFMPGRTATYSIFKALLAKYPHAKDIQPHHGYVELANRDEFCLVTSIREPFSRAVSAWRLFGWHVESPWWDANRFRIRDLCRDGGFRTFLTDPWLRSMGLHAPIWSQLVEKKIKVDYYIRYETLHRDVRRLPFLSPGEKIKLGHLHKSRHAAKWLMHYEKDPELIDIVREIYADDFKHFDYPTDLQYYIQGA